jgi:hypothetical protein
MGQKMKHQVEWFSMNEPYDSIGFCDYETTDDLEAYLCPLCARRTEYWEGTIDQDEMGNDIRGYSYDCYECGVHSAVEELG